MCPQSQLPASVQTALEMMFAGGKVSKADLDARALDQLKELDETQALDALQRFTAADLTNITYATVQGRRVRGIAHAP